MGFIFYKGSPRCVNTTLDGAVLKGMPQGIFKVGVFVNERKDNIRKLNTKYGLDYVQLHGEESVEYCSILQKEGIRIIKAVRIDGDIDFGSTLRYAPFIEMFLFDTKGSRRGGTGRKFDWTILDQYSGQVPFMLSGGISIDDVHELKEFHHPLFHGVDINSRFETFPGMKDVNLVSGFIKNIRHAVRSR